MKTYLQKRSSGDVFDVFEDFFKPMFYDEQLDSMRTDIKETDKDYQLAIEMPGFKKDEIKVSLENGYLTVSAEKNETQEEGDKNAVSPAKGATTSATRSRKRTSRRSMRTACCSLPCPRKSRRRSLPSPSQSNNRLRLKGYAVGNDCIRHRFSGSRGFPAGSFFVRTQTAV